MSELLVGAGYGRTVGLRGSPESLVAARALLPFWWEDSAKEPEALFDVIEPESAPLAIRNLERWVAEHAAGVVFVHAAVVAVEGRAILLPGRSYDGKTSLCVELLRRGAVYLSDEYAVLDAQGRVHPYPREIQLRHDHDRMMASASDYGAMTASEPLSVALAALLKYDATIGWAIEVLRPSMAVLSVLGHTLAGRSRPEETLVAVSAAIEGATCCEGSRGPAAEAVDPLLRMIN